MLPYLFLLLLYLSYFQLNHLFIDIFIDRLQEKSESNEYLNKLQQEDKYEEVKENSTTNPLNTS